MIDTSRNEIPINTQWKETLGSVTTAWIPLIALLYVSGYIVVSIHDAHFGINPLDPFRAKIVAAGFTFLVITGIACAESILVSDSIDASYEQFLLSPWRRWLLRISYGGLSLLTVDLATACVAASAFSDIDVLPRLVAVTLLCAGMVSAIRTSKSVGKFVLSGLGMFLLGMITIGIIIWLLPISKHISARTQLPIYMLVAQISFWGLAVEFGKVRSLSERIRAVGIIILRILVPIALYANWVYPQFRSAYGGGEMISVTLSTNLPGNSITPYLKGQMVDETSYGFYILPQSISEVKFVPRSAVSSINYENKTHSFF